MYLCIVLMMLSLPFLHCTRQTSPDQPSSSNEYRRTQLPADTTQLWFTPDSLIREMVIIDCPGGPDSLLEFQPRHRQRYRYLPGYERFSIISMYQAQSFNNSLYRYTDEFTFEDAAYEVAITSEMLQRAILFFKARGKRVIVAGSSYGAFVIQHYLANYDSRADQYIIMSGRLDINQSMVDETMRGNSGAFAKDGTIYLPDEQPIDIRRKDEDTREDLVSNRLKAAIGYHRYTDLLSRTDLSNVAYIYAVNDQQVGRLQPHEIEFLHSRGASVFADERGHTRTWQRFVDEVMGGNIRME
jgi:pimeloyl-ACP methyl ester carboxylesterase